MKLAAILLIALGLVVAVVPAFTDCQSQGRALTVTSGAKVPMKCHWSGIAELGLAVPLVLVGGSTAVSRRKETRRLQALLGGALGVLVILVPTYLVGVCASSDMLCNAVMRPTLILAGTLITAISLIVGVKNERTVEASA